MQRLEVSGAVRPIYGSLGVKRLRRAKLSRCTRCRGQDSNPSMKEERSRLDGDLQSHYRPGVAQRVPESEGSQIS